METNLIQAGVVALLPRHLLPFSWMFLVCFIFLWPVCVQAVDFFHNGFNCPDHVLMHGQVHVWVAECLLKTTTKKILIGIFQFVHNAYAWALKSRSGTCLHTF